jgi:nicotinamidase-related amidase
LTIMPTYDARTALLVVDVQNDFADPSGSLYVRGGGEIVPIVNAEVERSRAAGIRSTPSISRPTAASGPCTASRTPPAPPSTPT